jgi:ferritin-like metal-binding protein YciE
MARVTSRDIIIDYLQDAIATERNIESQLRAFARTGDQPEAKRLFEQHAEETKRQHERLTAHLSALGGSLPAMKSFLANLVGQGASGKVLQNLITAYAFESAEVAMYEALAIVAAAAGDVETERLARDIQAEERATAEKLWNALPRSALDSFFTQTGERTAGGGGAA